MELYVLLATFALLLLLGMPIAFVLGLTTLVYILFTGQVHFLPALAQRMLQGVNNFTLLAVPFFLLTGEIMNKSGITRRLVEFVQSVLGHLRGGLGYVNVVVSAFLSSIIGSANAVAAITSSSIAPEMRRFGYSNPFASALSAASATMGPIIPPSLVLIIYAVAANVSVGALFIAGVIPGLLLGAAFMLVTFLHARRSREIQVARRATLKEVATNSLTALPSLSIPAFILIGITTGTFTPTEAGAIACVIAFVLGVFVYGELRVGDMPALLARASVVTAGVLFIAATASLFAWVLAIEGIPATIAQGMLALSDEKWVLLLLITLCLLLVGLFLEPIAAILVTVPVLLPVAMQLGLDPVHFGLIVTLNLVLGLITPPVGLVLFIVSGITNVSVMRLSWTLGPYYLAAFVVLLLVIFVPPLTTWLPSLRP